MPAVLKPTLSRWGISSYETPEGMAAEVAALQPWVEVLPEAQNAEIVVVNSRQLVDRDLLDGLPDAKLVVTSTSGFDHQFEL